MSNFVFYESWIETINGFEEDFGKEYAMETAYALIHFATTGEVKTSKKSIQNWIVGSCMPNIISAQQRYDKAVQNGKLGGRPSIIDKERVLELRREGYTQNAIAEKLGCHVNSIRNILRPTITDNNLERDIERDKEKEKEKEVEVEPTITDNNLDKDIEREKEREKEVEVEVEAVAIPHHATTTNANALSNNNNNYYIMDYNPTVNCRYYTGDTFLNLLRLFGKQNYREEKYKKYINTVERVYGCKLDDNNLNNLNCALINLKLKNKNIKMSTTNSTYDYWIVDAVNHCKQYHILRDYKNQILKSIDNEEHIINDYVLDAKEEAVADNGCYGYDNENSYYDDDFNNYVLDAEKEEVAVDVADTSVADNECYGYDNEDSYYDDDYPDDYPF